MIHKLAIDEYLELMQRIPVLDVRTSLEFEQGHMVGAYNLPIFTNEERVQVGSCYKQQGREAAILLGFDLVGMKWSEFIRQALQFSPSKKIALYCWRGGMRSAAMAWVLDFYGFEVYLLEGGYKKYRQWVLALFSQNFYFCILGGMTGSGKTASLAVLKQGGEQVIDLEDLAQHHGSAYGSMGTLIQPTQEQFENNLALHLQKLDPTKACWIEDESMTIGQRVIPGPCWAQIRAAKMFLLVIPLEERIQFLLEVYGNLDKHFLLACTQRIAKRLGPEQTKNALAAITENRMADFIRLVLVYYDKSYRSGQATRDVAKVYEIPCKTTHADQNASLILACAQSIHSPAISAI